jgi:hypothetical protein
MCRPLLSTLVVVLVAAVAPAGAQAPKVVTRESTVTATVDRVERSTRVLTLRGEGNVFQTVYVDPSVKAFETVQAGDVVTVRYTESVVIQVRPRAPLSQAHDTTEEAKQAGRTDVIEQQKAVVTIEEIDSQGQSVTYRTAGGIRAVRAVTDKRLLEGLHVGDRIEVTLTRERAVSIDKARR